MFHWFLIFIATIFLSTAFSKPLYQLFFKKINLPFFLNNMYKFRIVFFFVGFFLVFFALFIESIGS
ncbi:MAG: hypothetical protein CMI95_02565 [Pelagibacteraceae bacterium]|nr:hypothetical protein [Pelagibacteraceae bacterium]